MKKAKILFVAQEIIPYVRDSHMGTVCRYLPQGTQERGKEIRTFMPRFGTINERRNQLHEVIRLSGMNLIIDDNDHPLIIKVASIQQARMQIYFIDNEDYFQRKFILHDKNDEFFSDNDERAVFYCRGVLETVKKLGWNPDLIHCHGWMSSLIPIYVKRAFKDNPVYSDAKVVFSIYDDEFPEIMGKDFQRKVKIDGITNKDISFYKTPNYMSMVKAAIHFSDAVVYGVENVHPELKQFAEASGKPVLPYQTPDTYIQAYNEFYDELLKDVLEED